MQKQHTGTKKDSYLYNHNSQIIETDGTMDIAIVRQVQPIFINKVKMTVAGQNNTPEPKKIPISIITIPIIEMDGTMDIAIVRQVQTNFYQQGKNDGCWSKTTHRNKEKYIPVQSQFQLSKWMELCDIAIATKKHFSYAYA